MRKEFLPFSPPYLGEEEIAEVVDSLRSGWITTGPKTKRFEQEFASFVNAPAALALSSCTAALHTALVAAEIGPGDEVITTPMTFTATVAVIEHVGAKPVLVDIEPDTMNIDPKLVAAAVTERTKAVIVVHYGGHPCDLDAIQAICDEHGLLLVEDAAHSLPAKYKGRMIGSGSNPVAYSFYATKNLTTAEGGMLTGDPAMIEKAVVYSLHGMNRDAWKRNSQGGSWRYDIVTPGFKYNMTDIQASMGLQQLKKMDRILGRRREIVGMYREALEPLGVFDLPVERDDVESAWHLFPIRIRAGALKISRDEFIEGMRERNIGTSVHFIPVHTFTYYREKYGFEDQDYPIAFRESERLVSLPLHPGLLAEDVRDVASTINEIVPTRVYTVGRTQTLLKVPVINDRAKRLPPRGCKMSKLSRIMKNPGDYFRLARKATLQPLCQVFESSSFFMQGQMDIHKNSRWHNPEFVSRTGGFFPGAEEGRDICKLQPWDNVRRDMLILFLRTLEENKVPGEFAEVGVYQGKTAKLFHYYAPNRPLHLFDTFEGFTDRSVQAEQENTGSTITSSHFADTSEQRVLEYIAPLNANVEIHKGYFPGSIPNGFAEKKFAFVHLDADLYEPILAGLRYFYDRLSIGGMIIVHDYNAWAGARSAVDDFFADREDYPLPLPDKSGSALIIKAGGETKA